VDDPIPIYRERSFSFIDRLNGNDLVSSFARNCVYDLAYNSNISASVRNALPTLVISTLNPPPKGLLINSALWSAVAHPHSDLSFATAISLTMEQVRVWLAASAAAAMPDFRNPHRLYGTHAMSASGTALSAAFLSFVSQNTIPNTLQWLGTWHPVSREWTSQHINKDIIISLCFRNNGSEEREV
jgi:hypothetical protein